MNAFGGVAPCATEVTVKSSPPRMQSPPAHTLAMEVRPSPSTLMRPPSSSIAAPEPLRAAGTNVWPIALNTWSAASVSRSPVPVSLPSCKTVYSSSTPVTLPPSAITRAGCIQWRMVTPLAAARSCSNPEAFMCSCPRR